MTSEELADAVTGIVSDLRARILGVGDEQYSTGTQQRVEAIPLGQLVNEVVEEVDDAIVYLAALRMRVTRLRQLLS